MISAVNSSPSFTGVVPVRVFIDGLETFDEKLLKQSCRQLSKVLTDSNKKEDSALIIKTFSKYDPSYKLNVNNQFIQPKQEYPNKKFQPSDFFRCIINRGRTFLITGPEAKKITIAGKNVGAEKEACKLRGIKNSFDLFIAQKNYGNLISDLISHAKFRLVEKSESVWKPVTLNINMVSNKKYGRSTFKMGVDSIDFT